MPVRRTRASRPYGGGVGFAELRQAAALVRRRRRAAGSMGRVQRGMSSVSTHSFVRRCSTVSISPLVVNALTGFGTTIFNLQFNFTLAGVNIYLGGVFFAQCAMPNFAEFSGLYDQYRIDSVECAFMFSNNNSSVNSPGTTLPIFILAKDFDDNANASYTDLQQYNNAVTWQVGEQQGSQGKKVVRVVPTVDTVLFSTALINGYGRSKPMFIDTTGTSTAVPHYGLKLSFDPIFTPAASTVLGYLSIDFKYHLTMKCTK